MNCLLVPWLVSFVERCPSFRVPSYLYKDGWFVMAHFTSSDFLIRCVSNLVKVNIVCMKQETPPYKGHFPMHQPI